MPTTTILVVEDDTSVAEMLRDVLHAEGFDVMVESDGEWGLRTFDQKDVGFVILDVLVPNVQGFDFITRLRRTDKGKDVPILVVSGVYRAAAYRDQVIERFGVVDYLDKPIDLDRMIDVLHDAYSSAYPEPRTDSRISTGASS